MMKVSAGYDAQKKYCEEKNLPIFISRDGRCDHCGGDLFWNGYTVEYASQHLITRCPHCSRSFCE